MSLEIYVAVDHSVFVNHGRGRDKVIKQNASHHVKCDDSVRTEYIAVSTDVGAEMNTCTNQLTIKSNSDISRLRYTCKRLGLNKKSYISRNDEIVKSDARILSEKQNKNI